MQEESIELDRATTIDNAANSVNGNGSSIDGGIGDGAVPEDPAVLQDPAAPDAAASADPDAPNALDAPTAPAAPDAPDPAGAPDDPAASDTATPERPRRWDGADYRTKVAAMSEDERVQATVDCINRRAAFRDILDGLLGFCLEQRSYEDIEQHVATYTNFARNRQEPRRYAFMLLRTGALDEIELDEDGQPLTEEAKQAAIDGGLDPEDLDTLVFDWRVVTTEAGRRAHTEFDPALRFGRLLTTFPDREEAFIRVLDFCTEPRSMGAIDDEFKGSAVMGFDAKTGLMRQPSSYMDKLEAAGMVAWNDQYWLITDEGRAYLESL